MLVHHPDPSLDRVLRRVNPYVLALDVNLALVRVVQPVEDVHEGRLAGAVLAEQGMHLTPAQVEVDVVVGEDPGEALGDPAQLEDRTLARHRGNPRGRSGPPPRNRSL